MKAQARELVGDPQGQWLTDSDIATLANIVYQQQIQRLAGTCSPYIAKLVVVPNLPSGTTSLTAYQQGAGTPPLVGLMKPRLIQSKIAGTTDNYYREMREFDVLPDVVPGSPNLQGGGWEWRSFVIWIVPFPQAMDLRVRGDFLPPSLSKDTDVLVVHPNMAHATAYGLAALAGAQVGNTQWEESYGAQAENTLDAIAAQLIRQQQRLTFRVGKLNGPGRGRR